VAVAMEGEPRDGQGIRVHNMIVYIAGNIPGGKYVEKMVRKRLLRARLFSYSVIRDRNEVRQRFDLYSGASRYDRLHCRQRSHAGAGGGGDDP